MIRSKHSKTFRVKLLKALFYTKKSLMLKKGYEPCIWSRKLFLLVGPKQAVVLTKPIRIHDLLYLAHSQIQPYDKFAVKL